MYAGMLTGKYGEGRLPLGPRGLLFRQILPGIEPLLDVMRQIATRRRKTVSQASQASIPESEVRIAGAGCTDVSFAFMAMPLILSSGTESTSSCLIVPLYVDSLYHGCGPFTLEKKAAVTSHRTRY